MGYHHFNFELSRACRVTDKYEILFRQTGYS